VPWMTSVFGSSTKTPERKASGTIARRHLDCQDVTINWRTS
jgi:hypothetical protein